MRTAFTKKVILIGFVFIVLIVMAILTISICANKSNQAFNLYEYGKAVRKAYDDAAADLVVAKVDDYCIYKYQLDIAKLKQQQLNKANNASESSEQSEKEILNQLIYDQVVIIEAKKCGIVVTEEDAKNMLDSTRIHLNEATKDSNKDIRKLAEQTIYEQNTFIKGFGLNNDEYTTKYELPTLVKHLTSKLFYQQFLSQFSQKEQEDAKLMKVQYDKYIENLVKTYSIIYCDEKN